MTYLPARPPTTSPTTAPASQGPLPSPAQAGDQVLVFRPGGGTYYVSLTSLTGAATATNRISLRDGSFLTLRDGSYLAHR